LANQIIKRANPNPNQIVKTEMANQVGFGKSNWHIKFSKCQIQIKLLKMAKENVIGFGKSNCQLNENESGQKEASSSSEWQIQIKLPKR
jgi:hypothetical protein